MDLLETPSIHETEQELPAGNSEDVAYPTVKERWQGAVGSGSGFVAVPIALLRLQIRLGLTPTDLLVLINLLAHWWDPAKSVFPRSTTIAKRMGISKRTVQRSTQKMFKAGLLDRNFNEDGRRVFHFAPLAARLDKDLLLSLGLGAGEKMDA
jgi:predicted transcriptional regulator